MLLELLLQQEGEHKISNIFTRERITFFKIGTESYCTAAGRVVHQSSPMFDSIPLKIFAYHAHDDLQKQKDEVIAEQEQYDSELWSRHGDAVLSALLVKACEIFVDKGPAEMVEYLEHYLTIIPDDAAKLMAKKLEDDQQD